MRLEELLDVENLQSRIDNGYISVRRHLTLPLRIYNYTSAAAYARVWDEATRKCRGLIVDDEGIVIARPMEKFFNYTDERPPNFALTKLPFVTTKLDGSLAVYYSYNGQAGISTRGAFNSAQAIWATMHWYENYTDVVVPPGTTPLFEIIYPDNRIVVDYHGMADLVLLCVIDNETGADIPPWEQEQGWWPGPVAQMHYEIKDIDQAYRVATGAAFEGGEGLVATWYRHNAPSYRCKIKHPRYLQLHSLVFGTSTKNIWRAMMDGIDLLSEGYELPNEFTAFYHATVRELRQQYQAIEATAVKDFAALVGLRGDRKAFAKAAKEKARPDILFKMLDGKDYAPLIWKSIEPKWASPYFNPEEI